MAWRKVECPKCHDTRLVYSDRPRKGKWDRDCPTCFWRQWFVTPPADRRMGPPVVIGSRFK